MHTQQVVEMVMEMNHGENTIITNEATMTGIQLQLSDIE